MSDFVHLKLSHSLFPLLFFIITIGSQSRDFNHTNCPVFNCGNVTIKYPFWSIDTQTQFCGYQGFGINCSSQTGSITLGGADSYYVKNIDYDTRSMVVIDDDVFNVSRCPRVRQNVRLETLPMNFSTYSVNLSFHFNCTGGGGSFPSFATPIPCFGNTSCVNILKTESENFDWESYWCDQEVVTTVFYDEDIPLPGGWETALSRGFELNWWTDDECEKCEASNGRCGRHIATGFKCFCPKGTTTNDDCNAMGLLDFLVGNEACEVEDHSPAVAGQMYKAAGVDVPSVSPTGREGQGLEVRPPLPENTGDLVVSPAGDDFDPHGYMLEEQDSSRQRQVDLEDIGSDDDQEPCVDGPSVLGKRSSISVEDYELPTPKSKKVLFPASPPLGTNLVRRYGGLQMAPHGSTIMALPACGNTVQPAAFVGTPSGQRFVPAWSFCVGDNGQTAGSVRDFMDNVVPPQLVMQSKLQGTSELLDDADMSLFHGFMGHILARQRLCEDHENLKVNYSDLKKEVESMAVVRKDLEAEREIVSSRDREISDLSAKMSDLEKERDGLVRKAQEYEDILAAKDKELATVAKTLEVERQAVESQSQQLDAAVQGRKDLLAVFPQLFKLLLDHPDVMNLMLEVNRAAHVFGKHIVGTKLRSVAGDAVLPFLDPLVESQMRAANALFEKKNFPILERIVQDLNISIEDLLAIVTPPSV